MKPPTIGQLNLNLNNLINSYSPLQIVVNGWLLKKIKLWDGILMNTDKSSEVQLQMNLMKPNGTEDKVLLKILGSP